jgi:hypothetical protein
LGITLGKVGLYLAILLMIAGCASIYPGNGYEMHYRTADGVTAESIAKHRVAPAPTTPLVERSVGGTPDDILKAYGKRSFQMIGSSMFNSGRNESDSGAIKQAQAIGADLVLILEPSYAGSKTSTVPIFTPSNTTSYTTGSATAYGPAGSVTAYGNATTTTQKNTTTFVPVTVDRYDYGAVYFIKRKLSLGTRTRDLNDIERQELGTNQGVVVFQVVDNTPAFFADILIGDVIAEIDGVAVPNSERYGAMIEERKGLLASFTLIRKGQKIIKNVQLNR